MESLQTALLFSGPVVLLLGLLGFFPSLVSLPPAPRKSLAVLCLLAAAGLSFISYFIGKRMGMEYFCTRADAGNLCGLTGVFGTGPLLSGTILIVAVGALRWWRRGAP